jgi:hypothetical protein
MAHCISTAPVVTPGTTPAPHFRAADQVPVPTVLSLKW